MNQIHPVMQAALAPFMPPKPANLPDLHFGWLTVPAAPRCPDGCFERLILIQGIAQSLECHFEFEAAQDGGRDDPSYPAQATLIAAYANGMDVSGVLSESAVTAIEEQALKWGDA